MNNLLMNYCHKWYMTVLVLGMAVMIVSCDDAGQSTAKNSPSVENAKANIKFSEDSVSAKSGVDIVVKVLMRDLPTTEGGGISINFDASMMSISSVEVNRDVWKFVNNNGVVDNAAGRVSDVLFSSYNAIPGNSDIATLTLHPLKAGTSQIVLSGSAVNPFASNGEAVNVSFGRLQVNTTAN